MAQLRESILRVVAYFDIFNYPVTLEEISNFLDQPVPGDVLLLSLQTLLDKQLIWQFGQFYSFRNAPHLVERRKKGNKLAVKQLKQAMIVSRVISWFPYIRGVGISGSLSKNVAYKDSDFDFFIITAANRLWIARSVLGLIVKVLARMGLRDLCCLNYYIDEQALEIKEKNIFTAVEVATLLPVQGKHVFHCFFSSNQWIHRYLPNSAFKKTPVKELSSWPLKKGVEWLLNNKLGDRIDNRLLKYFHLRWEKLRARNILTPKGYPLGSYDRNKHFCKPVPGQLQQTILSRLQEKMDNIKLSLPQ